MLQVRRMVVSVNLKREKVILVYVKKLICMISECTLYIWICCRRSQPGIGSGYVLLLTESFISDNVYDIVWNGWTLAEKMWTRI